MASIFSETVRRRIFLILVSGMAFACGFSLTVDAATAGTVTAASDSGPGSLRAVIASADSGDTIVFDAELSGETIELTSGAITIDKGLTITGPGPSHLTIDANHNGRIFTLTNGDLANGSLSISGLTLSNGIAPDRPGGLDRGGAIEQTSYGSLTISDMIFSGNAAGGPGGEAEGSGFGSGGAIYVSAPSGATSISDSTFIANSAGGPGGGGLNSGRGTGGAIRDNGGGTLTISNSTFESNSAGGDGGGGTDSGAAIGGALSVAGGGGALTITDSIFKSNRAGGDGGAGTNGGDALGGAVNTSFSSPTISGSTFAYNSAGGTAGTGNSSADGSGGAIYALSGSLAITNSTLVENAAGGTGSDGSGGAIMFSGSAALTSVTIAGNSASEEGDGAGIYGNHPFGILVAEATARATIISGNTGAENCNLPVQSSSYSLEGPSSSDTSCGFDRPSADPQLAALADNGGPTETRALQLASAAIDVVPLAQCLTNVDQRGEPRPEPGAAFCDIGAFERQDPVAPTITSSATADFQVATAGSFTVKATGGPTPSLSQNGELPDGVSFTDNGDGTASLAGMPAAGTDGTYLITIEASNGAPPDAVQSFTLTVDPPPPPVTDPPPDDPPPNNPTDSEPPSTPRPPLALDLSGGERRTLRQLLRTRKLVVKTRVNDAARVALRGRARLRAQTRRRSGTRLITVFKSKTVHLSAADEERVTLVLTRKGRKALRNLDRVRLVIAGKAVAADKRASLDRHVLNLSRTRRADQQGG